MKNAHPDEENTMDLTRNGKGTLAFLITTQTLLVYDVIGMYTHMQWGMAMPKWMQNDMQFFVNVVLTLVFFGIGFGYFFLFDKHRAGPIIALAVSALNIITNVPVTYWRLKAGFPYGATICGTEVIVGLVCGYFALAALREMSPVGSAVRSERVGAH